MLVELRIRDYAVIHDLTLELDGGLSALSGETGAGKSIIVGALSLLLGERASSDVVREGAEAAVVEGRFDISSMPELTRRLEDQGITLEDGFLILKRQVAAEGRNRAWANGSPATASLIGDLGSALVDLHGQHEHQTLLRHREQRRILDAFAGATEIASAVADLHTELFHLKKERSEHDERRKELEEKAGFLREQLSEIEAARLQPGEDDTLADEVRRLEHSEELIREATRLHDRLYGGDASISDELSEFDKTLQQLGQIDPALDTHRQAVEGLYHSVVELGRELLAYTESSEHDPARLEEARQRQDTLFRMMRKYGPTLPEVFEAEARIRQELEELDGSDLSMGELDKRVWTLSAQLQEKADELTRLRDEAAATLSGDVERILPLLGMASGRFQVALNSHAEPGPGGNEDVEFRVSVNPGFEPRALTTIASGGEISRIMLALKGILAKVDRVPTLVFDEIDAGIGGVVAGKVGEELRRVAGEHQVFVVTHLPQIASRAHQQIFVEKAEEGGVAKTRVRELYGEDRILEIARMLGGDPESETSRQHAREMLAGTWVPEEDPPEAGAEGVPEKETEEESGEGEESLSLDLGEE